MTIENDMNEKIANLDAFRKKKMPTKSELLNKTLDQGQEINKKFETIQIILNNFNKRMKDNENKFTNDTMQSIILILALKEAITQELKIDDTKWNAIVENVTKRLADERERDFDSKNGLVTIDRAAKIGDYLIVSFDGTINGEAFEGGHNDGVVLCIGSKHFLEDFENSLIDKKKGDVFDTLVKFPENYPAKDLANKEANFKITVLSVKEKILEDKPDGNTAA